MPENIVITAELKDLVSGHLKDISSQVDRLEGSLSNINRSQSASGGGGLMGSVLGANLLTGAISRGVSAIKDFAVGSYDAYAKQEMYEARLTTLLHGRENALMALKNITKDAALTPFDKESLVQGNSMLIGAGESAQGARKSIMDLGNAIAATGGGSDELKRMSVNLAQIKSIGKASALDVKQFMYANIPIYEMLSRSMHKQVSEIKDMDISYKDLTKAMAEARMEGGMFYEGLENANKTLTGQASNLGDSWEQLKTSIGKSQSGILKDTISWANNMVSAMNKSFERSDRIESSIKKYGGRQEAYSGGSEQNQAFLEATANLVQNSINAASSDKDSAMKQQGFLLALLKNKTAEYEHDLPLYKTKADLQYYSGQKTNELSVIRGALDEVNATIKGFNKKTDPNTRLATPAISDLEKVAKGNRPTQVNINIENLVREYKPQVADNGKEIYKVTQEDIAKALLSVVNDASVMKFGS